MIVTGMMLTACITQEYGWQMHGLLPGYQLHAAMRSAGAATTSVPHTVACLLLLYTVRTRQHHADQHRELHCRAAPSTRPGNTAHRVTAATHGNTTASLASHQRL